MPFTGVGGAFKLYRGNAVVLADSRRFWRVRAHRIRRRRLVGLRKPNAFRSTCLARRI